MLEMKITERDQQIINLLLQGMRNEEIGDSLQIRSRTVKQHLRTLYMRAGISGGYKRVKLCHMLGNADSAPLPKLTPRQLQIAQMVAEGLQNKQIGDAVGSSEQVVKNHLRNIFDILGVWSRLELATRYGKALTERAM